MAYKKPLTRKIGKHILVDSPIAISAYKIKDDGTRRLVMSFRTWDAAIAWAKTYR